MGVDSDQQDNADDPKVASNPAEWSAELSEAEPPPVDADAKRAARRDSLGLALVAGAYAVSFGAISTASGLTILQTQVLSLVMFTGASQFAFIGVIGSGGAAIPAIAAAAFLGIRNGFYGVRLAPLLHSRPLIRRLPTAHFVIDETTAMAIVRPDERVGRYAFWTTAISLFIFWNSGTLIGSLAGSTLGDPKTYGLDAAVSAAFLGLLWPRLEGLTERVIALAGAAVALVMVPLTPIGVPVLVAASVALYGLRTPTSVKVRKP